jgi:hypothetical protein
MSNIPFDLEEKIMECWNVTSDIKILYEECLDSPEPMNEDELSNILIGLEALYNRKFSRLFHSYEDICKHGGVFLDKGVVDDARLVDLDNPVDKQEWGDNTDNERMW